MGPTLHSRNARIGSILAIGAAVLALVLHVLAGRLSFSEPLDATAISPRAGAAYTIAMPDRMSKGWLATLAGVRSDTNDTPSVSRLIVKENGKVIGPAHTIHADIEARGGGRYSHWLDVLHFSASDNSDPRTNGRKYTVHHELAPATWLTAILLAFGLAAADRLLLARGLRAHGVATGVAFWALAMVVAVYANLLFERLVPYPVAHPDSGGYLGWSLMRTLGYPGFLHLYQWAFGDWSHLQVVQLNMLLASVLTLAFAISRLTHSYLFAWAMLAIVAGNANMILSAADLLTEAPFATFTMLHVALLALFLGRPRVALALLAGLSLAAAILMKSVAMVLLGPLMLLLVFAGRARRRGLAIMFVPAVLAWFMPSAYNLVRNGFFETSVIGGYALAGHVAWAIGPRPGSAHPAEAAHVLARVSPVIAKRPHFVSSQHYIDYTANEYNELLWANILPELAAYHRAVCAAPPPCTWKKCDSLCERTLNKVLMKLGREAAAAEPSLYARHVALHDYGLWRDVFHPGGGGLLSGAISYGEWSKTAYAQNGGYLNPKGPAPPFPPAEEIAQTATLSSSVLGRLFELASVRDGTFALGKMLFDTREILLTLGMVASTLVFFAARLPPATILLAYCGLALNAYFLGTALFQPSLVRYAWPMQGVAATLLALYAWLAWRGVIWLAERLRRSRGTPLEPSPAAP